MNKYFCFLFLLIGISSYAQENAWSIQISQCSGKLIKHTKKMKFEPSGFTQFTELDLCYHTQGKKDWEKYYHLPRMGLGLRYLDMGRPSEILGDGFSFFPFIDLGFFQKKNSSLRFMIGCGLAYLNQTYNIKSNPSQTAIGSHWNNLTTFQCRYEYSFVKTQFLSAGISLSHISNGTFQAPNLGLNFLAATIGYSFSLKPSFSSPAPYDSSAIPSKAHTMTSSSFSVAIEYGMSLKESEIPGGPKFLIQWYSLDFGYQYNNYKSWRLSVDVEHNNLDIYKETSPDGIRINTYLAHQWLFGNVGLTFRTGYEFKRNHTINASPIVTKLDLCYIMPFQLIPHVSPYLGFSLKTHFDTAEYIGAMAGLRFHKKKLPARDLH